LQKYSIDAMRVATASSKSVPGNEFWTYDTVSYLGGLAIEAMRLHVPSANRRRAPISTALPWEFAKQPLPKVSANSKQV